jgi:alpha-tubulin suppressor-like RCC1 family protein
VTPIESGDRSTRVGGGRAAAATVRRYSPPPPPGRGEPSRRQIVGAGLWAVPAVALATSTPAFANTSDTSSLSVSTAGGKIPAAGATPVTVTVRDSLGQPRAGAAVSLTAPSNAVLGASDGVTAGDGTFSTTLDLRRPGAKPGSTVTVTALSGSDSATATLTVLGANVLGWGSNSGGQTGVGPNVTTSALTTATALAFAFASPVVSITSNGGETALALLEDGTVWTVGADRFGVRGPGVAGGRTWQQLSQLSDVVEVVAGGGVAFARKRDNSLWSWGTAEKGVRGDGTYASSSGTSADSTVATKILGDVIQVASGNDVAYALLSTGKVMGWGNNAVGAVGDGTNTDRSVPVEVLNLTNIVQIAAQYNGGYALDKDGRVWAWGRNEFGQCGNGTASSAGQATPVQVSLPKAASAVTALGDGGMALLSDRAVWSWGRNDNGQLGDGNGGSWDPIERRRQLSPVAVSGMSDAKQLSAMSSGGLVLKNDGTVWTWGSNNHGQLGNGTTTMSTTPVQVQGLSGYAIGKLCPANGGGQAQNPYVLTVEATVTVDVDRQVAAGTPANIAAKVAAGSTVISGASVLLSASGNAVLGTASGTTGSDGYVRTTVTPDANTWPGATVRIDATTSADSASDTITVLGANALGWGPNAEGQAGSPSGGNALLRPTPAARAFPSPVVSMTSSGAGSGFALLADGSVWTVGEWRWGLRGQGITGASTTWTPLVGISDVKQIAVSGGAAFALKRDGSLWSWGSAGKGVRGDGSYASAGGTSADSDTPSKILEGVVDVAAADSSAFALLNTGKVMAWGWNYSGALGDGADTDRSLPVEVKNLTGVVQIAAQYVGGYALKSDGSVWAWGRNILGQCGIGTSTEGELVPVQVPLPMATVQVVGAGDTAFALLTDKTVRAWGRNDYGLVGNGAGGAWDPIEKRRQLSPVAVKNLADVRQVSATTETAYALKNDGTVWSWGINRNGEIGDGTTGEVNNRLEPVQVRGLDGYAITRLCPVNGGGQGRNPFAIFAQSTVTIDVDDTVAAGGTAGMVQVKVNAGSKGIANAPLSLTASSAARLANSSGQTDATGMYTTTVTVDDWWIRPGTIGRVTAGSGSSTAFDTFTILGANVFGWGNNTQGQSGNGNGPQVTKIADQAARAFPSPVVTMTSNGAESAFALLADGTVWTIGADRFHVRGPNVAGSRTWLRFEQLTDVVQLVASGGAVFARKRDKSLWSWGVAEKGVRGDGVYASTGYTSADSGTATKILDDVIDVAAGNAVVFALLSNGRVKGWGDNYQGGVGDGTTTDRSLPVDVLDLTDVVQLAAQYNGGYALKKDGTVWAWGRNEFGQCGNGSATTTGNLRPVQVTLPKPATQVAAAGDAGFALLNDNSVFGWGRNDYGQVGDGNGGSWDPIEKRQQPTPVAVVGMTDVKQVSASSSGGLALKNDGTVWAWGGNDAGQLGDNTTTTRTSPVQVQGLNGHTIVKLSPQNGGGQARNPFAITAV